MEDDISKEIKQKLTELSSYWNTQYKQIGDDLKFASGDQWSEAAKKQRRKRPTLTLNVCNTYIRRIVNAVKMSPFGINISCDKHELAELVSGVVKAIEYNSNASTAYETALEHATIGGLGFIVITNDYANAEDLEQVIKINTVRDPRQIMIDPHATCVSDARYGIYYTHIDKDYAKEQYGNDIDLGQEYFDIYESFSVPEGSVVDLYYYKIDTDEKMKYWYSDGTSSYEELEMESEDGEIESDEDSMGVMPQKTLINKRKVFTKELKIYHYIGQKLIEETELDIPYIPIVPVFGNIVYDDNLRYAGLIRDVHDAQMAINYLASTEQELIASAPKNPYVIASTQVQGHEQVWARSAVDPAAFLPYTPVQGVEAPKRENNVAQTQSLQAAKTMILNDMQRLTGIFDPQLGTGGTNESGVALGIKNQNGDIATAGYIDGLANAITQVGKIVLAMIPIIYDTERAVQVMDEEGGISYVKANMKDVIDKMGGTVSVYASAGPSYESKRKEGLNTIIQLSAMLPEDKKTALLDIVTEQVELTNKNKVISRVKKLMDPMLLGEDNQQMDPQAVQALQTADQTIQEQQATINQANQIIANLQTYIIQKDKEIETKALIEAAKLENQFRIAQLKEQGADARTLAQIEASFRELTEKLEQDSSKKIIDAKQNQEKINMDKSKQRADSAIGLINAVLPKNVNPRTV